MFVMTMTTGIKSKLQQSDLVICCYHLLEPQTCVLTGPLLMFPLQPQPEEEEDGDGEADMVSIALVSIAASSLQPPGTVLDKLTRFCNGTHITKYFCCRRTLYNVQAACTVVQVHTPPTHHAAQLSV